MKLYRQETEYTCTCAVARTLLGSKSEFLCEMEIEREMKVDPIKGASVFQLMSFLKDHGIESELIKDSSFEELKAGDFPKLLLFSLWGKIPHVAIIESASDKGLTLLDPATGKTFLKFKTLTTQWFADEIEKGFVKLHMHDLTRNNFVFWEIIQIG